MLTAVNNKILFPIIPQKSKKTLEIGICLWYYICRDY